MPEIISEFIPPKDLLFPQYKITDLVAQQKPLSELMERASHGELGPADIIEGFQSLRHVIDLRLNRHEQADFAFLQRLDTKIEEVLYTADDDTSSPKTAVVQGGVDYHEVVKNLRHAPEKSVKVQADLRDLCALAKGKGFIKEDEPLPKEITHEGLTHGLIADVLSIMVETAQAKDAMDQTPYHAEKAVRDVFERIERQMDRGSLRVYTTHNEASSMFRTRSALDPNERHINVRAEDIQNFGASLEAVLDDAKISTKRLASQTDMTVEEIAIRYVAVHELGHALHMSTYAPDSAIEAFLLDHPEDAVSAHFNDATYAEGERFAEGLALQYLTQLLVRAGFDDQAKIDKVVKSIQADHLIANQEWYAKAAESNESLGLSRIGQETVANAAFLGYGLPLNAAELLERFEYVATTINEGSHPAIDKMLELKEAYGMADWWSNYLREKGIELSHVQQAAEEAKLEAERLDRRAERRHKLGTLALYTALLLGVFGATYKYNEVTDRAEKDQHQYITTSGGHILNIERVMSDGDVVFESEEPATPDVIAARVEELQNGSVVIGKDASGQTLYIGQEIGLVGQTGDYQSVNIAREVIDRLPNELQKIIGQSGENQERFSELLEENYHNLIVNKDVLITAINLRDITAKILSELR